eukprot:750939-Hanusia_phi.AAC.2
MDVRITVRWSLRAHKLKAKAAKKETKACKFNATATHRALVARKVERMCFRVQAQYPRNKNKKMRRRGGEEEIISVAD